MKIIIQTQARSCFKKIALSGILACKFYDPALDLDYTSNC